MNRYDAIITNRPEVPDGMQCDCGHHQDAHNSSIRCGTCGHSEPYHEIPGHEGCGGLLTCPCTGFKPLAPCEGIADDGWPCECQGFCVEGVEYSVA